MKYAKHIIGKFDETLLESSDSHLLMNFKALFESIEGEQKRRGTL